MIKYAQTGARALTHPRSHEMRLNTDKDGDKKLTKEEVLEFFKEQGQTELPDGLWAEEDKNGDGVIDWDEFGGPQGEKDEL